MSSNERRVTRSRAATARDNMFGLYVPRPRNYDHAMLATVAPAVTDGDAYDLDVVGIALCEAAKRSEEEQVHPSNKMVPDFSIVRCDEGVCDDKTPDPIGGQSEGGDGSPRTTQDRLVTLIQ